MIEAYIKVADTFSAIVSTEEEHNRVVILRRTIAAKVFVPSWLTAFSEILNVSLACKDVIWTFPFFATKKTRTKGLCFSWLRSAAAVERLGCQCMRRFASFPPDSDSSYASSATQLSVSALRCPVAILYGG